MSEYKINPVDEMSDIQSEAGVIASLIFHPEYYFYCEKLEPRHFTDEQNQYMYSALSYLAKGGCINPVDSFGISQALNANPETRGRGNTVLSTEQIKDFVSNAQFISRSDVHEYIAAAEMVVKAAFRRETYHKLTECQKLCVRDDIEEIEQKIYAVLDNVMMTYSSTREVPEYRDVAEQYWKEIQERQRSGAAGIPFKFPTLNQFVTIEPGELVIFAAEAKQGKSMILLNCAVDLLCRGKKVMYIDSELNSRMFTCRLLSHLSGIEFRRVREGTYSAEEGARINKAMSWIKNQRFTHLYMPMFDAQSIYMTVKKVFHTQGIDVLIIDYFKGRGDGDAFASYQELGRMVDMVKNQICGDMGIAGIGAAQATADGKIADSAKIGRNASSIIVVQDKTPNEMIADGQECGNKKMRVILNRNGSQMARGEYIDLWFRGDFISYEEARQHIPSMPY